jgi:hypothetical protein
MYLRLVFRLDLWRGESNGEGIITLIPSYLTSEMVDIITRAMFPYQPDWIELRGSYAEVGASFNETDLVALGDNIYMIMVQGNAPDTWMEGDLSLPEYPDDEFVPTLVSFHMEV